MLIAVSRFCFEIIEIDPIFFFFFNIVRNVEFLLASTSAARARLSFSRIPQWLLCVLALVTFTFHLPARWPGTVTFPAKCTHALARVHAQPHSLASALDRMLLARGGQDMHMCGWKCRTAVHPVGCVGWVARKTVAFRTSLTRIGCSSCRRTM